MAASTPGWPERTDASCESERSFAFFPSMRQSEKGKLRDAAIRWLRVCFWIGAVLDAGAAIQMLVPSVFGLAYGIPGFRPGSDYRFAMGMGASLMLGWSALLLWADRRPFERRGVLILTLVPVVAGLLANEVRGVVSGFVSAAYVAPVALLQTLLAAGFVVGWVRAGHAVDGKAE